MSMADGYDAPEVVDNPLQRTNNCVFPLMIPSEYASGQVIHIKVPDGRYACVIVPVNAKLGAQYDIDCSHMTMLKAPPINDFCDVIRIKQFLKQEQWSTGLQHAGIQACQMYPYHFYLCDNSSSMETTDANRLLNPTDPTSCRYIVSTRWEEMHDFVQFHAQYARETQTHAEFRFLNNYEAVVIGDYDESGVRKSSISSKRDTNHSTVLTPQDEEEGDDISKDMRKLKDILCSAPVGETPILHHLKIIHQKISKIKPFWTKGFGDYSYRWRAK